MKTTLDNQPWSTWLLATLLITGATSSGCAGSDGTDGEQGLEGTPGEVGAPGADGKDGVDGNNGANGIDGADGKDGADGSEGDDGDDGVMGEDGETGPAGPPGDAAVLRPNRLLNARIGGWIASNREAIDQLVTDFGSSSPGFDPARRPVAVFDWDNTVMKNDIGDQTMAFLVEHDKILQPPAKNWLTTNPNLSAAAVTSLNAECDDLAPAGDPLPTSTDAGCAAAIFSVYFNGVVTGTSTKAWDDELTYTINQPYAWVAQLLAGYSPSEVRAFADDTLAAAFAQPIGATKTVGGISMPAYVRVYDQMDDLINVLQDASFDVWIVTASPQYVVDAISDLVGVPDDHVIGIRNVVNAGVLTYGLQGCGTTADDNTTIITFDRGKRCWINKVIFGLAPADQLATAADVTKRPVFVAGDSDTDIAMIKDATELKLAINRNKTQLMCNAYSNHEGRWLVQPMFIAPKGQLTAGYPCSTALDQTGMAIVDEAGAAMTNQADSTFALP